MIGGELHGLTRLLLAGRNDALKRMRLPAMARGANAMAGLRYDTLETLDTSNEVVSYGTAVAVQPVEPYKPYSAAAIRDSDGNA